MSIIVDWLTNSRPTAYGTFCKYTIQNSTFYFCKDTGFESYDGYVDFPDDRIYFFNHSHNLIKWDSGYAWIKDDDDLLKTIICDSNNCSHVIFELNNSYSTLDIKCLSQNSCYNLTINGSNNGQVNIYCNNDNSCKYLNINTDQVNSIHINVTGENALQFANFDIKNTNYIPGTYSLIKEMKSWYDADSYCIKYFGSHLATIQSESDISATNETCGAENMCWIGLNDLKNETDYKWVDGSDYNGIKDWAYGEPDRAAGRAP